MTSKPRPVSSSTAELTRRLTNADTSKQGRNRQIPQFELFKLTADEGATANVDDNIDVL
jgi:hypothetical protein